MILTSLPENIKVVAVTKNHSASEVQAMLDRNPTLKRIGENRFEEAEKAWGSLPRELERHFLGKLQHRKIKKIATFFDVIQSIETKEQATAVSKISPEMRVFIQVNISEKPNRQGCTPEQTLELAQFIRSKTKLQLEGLMGIASPEPERARMEFRTLKGLQTKLDIPELSMGMSGDYKIALEEGATMIRLGTCLFEG